MGDGEDYSDPVFTSLACARARVNTTESSCPELGPNVCISILKGRKQKGRKKARVDVYIVKKKKKNTEQTTPPKKWHLPNRDNDNNTTKNNKEEDENMNARYEQQVRRHGTPMLVRHSTDALARKA